jgi:hypothetical protein
MVLDGFKNYLPAGFVSHTGYSSLVRLLQSREGGLQQTVSILFADSEFAENIADFIWTRGA